MLVICLVTEAVDANAASPLAALKKADAASGAEQTVAGTGWLPACLRMQVPASRDTNSNANREEADQPAEAGTEAAMAA